jgi:glutamine synthetase
MLTHLLYTDLIGKLRRVSLMINGDPDILSGIQAIVDGSSLMGFLEVENSDLLVRPVTSRPLTTGFLQGKHYISGLFTRGEERYVKDPRFIAERLTEYLRQGDLEARVGVEIEFYIAKSVNLNLGATRQCLEIELFSGVDFPQSSLWYVKTYNSSEASHSDRLFETILSELEKNGFFFNKTHRENGPRGQIEVSTLADTPVEIGDFVQVFKYIARVIGEKEGFKPIFLAKPFPDDYGSGLHIHVSLWRGASNIFAEGGELSGEALYFIGGLLEHARSLAAFTNPTVNSYRRLVEGFEAPVYVSWGVGNRTTAVRVPLQNKARIEYRPPDPTANPYLAISAVILAGLDGIRRKIDPGPPVSVNLFENPSGCGSCRKLPASLEEAVEALESDHEYLKPVFPSELVESYVELKKREAKVYRTYTTPVDYLFYADI